MSPLHLSRWSRPRDFEIAFWQQVLIGDACWEWQGLCLPITPEGRGGYGRVGNTRFAGPGRLAHHAAWVLAHGPIPAGKWVLHTCDNRICVRPDHLFLGTAEDNTQDMLSKKRGRWDRRK